MRIPLIFLLGVAALSNTKGQSFNFPVPADWQGEEIPFPIEFAPTIPFKGTEYVRFTPGWGDPDNEEHWSYCFVWWIRPDSRIDANLLSQYMQEYYNGLVSRNIISREIPQNLVVPTVAQFSKGENPKSFRGTINMLDYHTNLPIQLNLRVYVIPCEEEQKLAIFFEVSPQGTAHDIWKKYQLVKEGFKCAN